MNRHFSKENIWMAHRLLKRCLTLLIIREIQIKTTMRYYFTPIRMDIMKKSQHIISANKDVEKREPSFIAVVIVNWCSHHRKQYRDCSKNLKYTCHIIRQFHFWVLMQRKQKHEFKKIYAPLCSWKHYSQ